MPALAPSRQRSPIVTCSVPPPDSVPMIDAPPPMSVPSPTMTPWRDPALDHRRAERAGVEVAEALVHHGRALGEVGAEAHPVGVGDAHPGGHDVVGHRRELVEAVHRRAPCLRRRSARRTSSRSSAATGPRSVQATVASRPKTPSRLSVRGRARRCDSRCRRRYTSAADAGARVDVDRQPDRRGSSRRGRRSRRSPPARRDVDLGRRLLAESPQPEPAEPGVERRAVGGDRREHRRPTRGARVMVTSTSGRSVGNRMTSLIVSTPASSITSRSMPMPRPPVGGMPYSRARR